MTTLKEQMQDRMDSRPDKHTIKWLQAQFEQVATGYRGLTHATNRVLAEVEDQSSTFKDMNARINVQAEALFEANVAIGKMQSEITELQESMEKARSAYSELKKKVN